MSHKKVTRNRSRLSTPSPQNLSMIDQLGVQSSSKTPKLQNTIHTQNLNAHSENNLSYIYNMDKNNLSKLTKNQLIELILAKERPVPAPRTKKVKPTPHPRKSVKQMVQNYENNIIKPPVQFRDGPQPLPRNNIIPPPIQFADKPKAAPRVKKVLFDNQLIPKAAPRTKKIAPIPTQRTQITEVARAFKG